MSLSNSPNFPKLDLSHEELLTCQQAFLAFDSPFLCDGIMNWVEEGHIGALEEEYLLNEIHRSINEQFSLYEYLHYYPENYKEQRQLRLDWLDQELTRTNPDKEQDNNE